MSDMKYPMRVQIHTPDGDGEAIKESRDDYWVINIPTRADRFYGTAAQMKARVKSGLGKIYRAGSVTFSPHHEEPVAHVMRTRINGHRVLFRVTTRESTENNGAPCPFVVVCADAGSKDRPPALITAYWDGVSDAWQGSRDSKYTPGMMPGAVLWDELDAAVGVALKRAGWGGG